MIGKRNILTLLSLLPVLFSCASIETFQPKTGEVPVDFSWYTYRPGLDQVSTTRADSNYFVGGTGTGVERHLNEGSSFGVFGYFHAQVAGAAGRWADANRNVPNLFYNEPVSVGRDGALYTYSYNKSRFWPKNTLDRMSFIAYYPYNSTVDTDGNHDANAIVEPFLDRYNERDGMVGFYYTVHEDAADQVDFMVSDLCQEQSYALWDSDNTKGLTGNANGKVKFFFHHALSQVRVKSVNFDTGGNDNLELKINYILFRNVAVYGQCIPVPDFGSTTATGRTTVTPTWPVGSLVAKRPNMTSGVRAEVCYDESTGEWKVSEYLLMIPHQFFTDATIEVNFDVIRKKDPVTGEYYSYTGNTLSAPLTTTSVYGWQAGKIYTYNITLDMKQIKVTAEEVDWLDAGEDVIMDN